MAEATRPRDNPLHRGLPDEIAVWEILVRLPPKAVLRCRAVCPAWRRATSSRDFLLAHHARQPSLPLLYGYEYSDGKFCQNILTFEHQTAAAAQPTAPLVNGYNSAGEDGRSVHIVPFHHQAADLAPAMPPCAQPVTRLDSGDAFMNPEASCDGLLIHFECFMLSICNPATHQYAPLMQLQAFRLMGMYRHSPTGEYRLLLGKLRHLPPDGQDSGPYVFTLGSGQPPRRIGYPEVEEVIHTSSVLFGGNLHWHMDEHLSKSASNLIMVFDTTAELFRQMRAPAVSGNADLFEMGGMLGMASFNFENTIIDIWVMQDYESQVWAFKCRIELPVEELGMEYRNLTKVVVMAVDGELLVLVKTEDWLHYVDINGKLVASAYRTGILPTQLQLKQSLVPHAFFPTLEGYVVNDSPFI